MHLTNALSTFVSMAYLASANAAATDLELASSPSFLHRGPVERGWSSLEARQEAPPPADPNNPSDERLVHVVKVGDDNGSLKFFPEKVSANISDVIQFHFYPKNHTITESLFAQPCVPLPAANATEMRPGQRSGFVPVAADTQSRPIYNMIVNDTKPMWIFCGQAPHCQKGMAMVINQKEDDPEKTLEKYKEAAAALPVPSPPASSSPAAPPPPAPGTNTPAPPPAQQTATATTQTPAGPSLVGTTSAAASIATFTGGANRDLAAWGSTWSVGLLGLVGMGIWL